MSEFYAQRRTNIADISALVGMGLAALGASLTNLKVLATGFKTGNLEPALLRFGVVVVIAAAAGGGCGLLVGRWVGARWERRHRAHRPPDVEESVASHSVAEPVDSGTFVVRELSAEVQRAFALKNGRASPWFGAWDGPRLVAIAQRSATGTWELHTDPGYDRELLRQAVTQRASSP